MDEGAIGAAGIDPTTAPLDADAERGDPAVCVPESARVADASSKARGAPYRALCHGYAHCCVCPDCLTRAAAVQGRLAALIDVSADDCGADPMMCECDAHRAERAAAVVRGPRDVAQPWTTRPAAP